MKIFAFLILFIGSILVHGAPVTIGVLEYAPPFSTANGGIYYGFVIDLMNAVCKRLKWECTYKSSTLSEQINLLNQGSIDLAFTAAPITSADMGNFLYSIPYIPSNGQFVALAKSTITSVEGINNKKIGALKTTLYNSILESKFGNLNQVKAYDTANDMITGLSKNEVDVIVVNDNLAKYVIENALEPCKLVGDKFPLGEGYGILAMKKNADLIKQINSTLLGMEADGSYLKIYKEYFSD